MKPIIWWSLWARRRTAVFWTIGITLFLLLNMIFYPSFKEDAEELQKSFESIPDTAVQLLGGSTDFFSPIGFMNSQIYYMMLPLLLIGLAISLGSSVLAKEEQEGTIELLLARPVSRSKLLLAKALTAIAILIGVSLVATLSVIVAALAVDIEVPTRRIVEVSFVCFLLALCTGAIAFCLTALGRARRLSLGLTIAIAVGGYVIASLSGTVKWLEGVSRIFPFSYYHSEALLRGQYDWSNIIYYAVVIAAMAAIAWYAFKKRDISAQ